MCKSHTLNLALVPPSSHPKALSVLRSPPPRTSALASCLGTPYVQPCCHQHPEGGCESPAGPPTPILHGSSSRPGGSKPARRFSAHFCCPPLACCPGPFSPGQSYVTLLPWACFTCWEPPFPTWPYHRLPHVLTFLRQASASLTPCQRGVPSLATWTPRRSACVFPQEILANVLLGVSAICLCVPMNCEPHGYKWSQMRWLQI